jgi:nucleoside-diphosphate-sugar epimerase
MGDFMCNGCQATSAGKSNNLLIIGAGGFLGSHLAVFLKKQNENGLVYCTSRTFRNERDLIYLDVNNPETFYNLPKHIDIIYYTVMSSNYHHFPEYASEIWNTNVQGLFRTLEYARNIGVKHFILASSGSVYAPSKYLLNENSALAIGGGSNFYAATKIAAEALVNSYTEFFSISCLRFFFPYGKGLAPYMLLSRMMHNIKNKLPIILDGNDGFEFNPIYIDDAVSACVAASSLEGLHTINVAGPEKITLGGICRIMGNILGYEPNFIKGGKFWRIVSQIDYMCNILDIPRINIQEGITQFIKKQTELRNYFIIIGLCFITSWIKNYCFL